MKHSTLSANVKVWLTFFRVVIILAVSFSAFTPGRVTTVFADKLVCGVPGRDGPVSISGIVNTYYPGAADVSAGSTAIPVGSPSGAATPIQAGDLLLVIQMQGADINSTNTGAYGDGVPGDPGSGFLASNFSAGLYEYVVATSAVAGGSVSISSGLVNSYFQQDFPVGGQGQRRFQVVRVPQYSSVTVSGAVTSLPWNGSVGGIVALDVAGTLDLNGNSIDVSRQGFRGGGGVDYDGVGFGSAFESTDYRTLSTATLNASKGEGIAGTPRFVFNGTAVVDLGIEGYPDGSFARGAPGNAGGGGTDGNPVFNNENSGGGGGGNGGAGGTGGNSWDSDLSVGGFGGSTFPATPSRLSMGGGGGAGTINNNNPVLSSGGAGGGIVMVRAGTVTGSGTISANGSDGQDQPLYDSGGGGGAGGSVLVVAQATLPVGLAVTANGGAGGDAWPTESGDVSRHGPGGGGGGGVIYTSATAGSRSAAGGVNGVSSTSSDHYGSTPGSPGVVGTITPANITTGISGAECIPTPVTVKTTSTPVVTQTLSGTTGEYTIRVSIPANQGTALGFSISDVLPTGFTYASTFAINLSGGATRTSVVDPTAGTSTPAWGTFDIPGGGQVEIIFTVDIDASVPAGVYQNPATATYTDPTRTVTTGTTTAEYDPASSTGEDIEVITAPLPDLTVSKTNNVSGSVQPNSPFNWTITVSNIGAGGAAFTDGQTILSDALPGAAGYYPQGALTITNATPPTGTINCSISGTSLTCVASGVVTLTTGASFSITFTVTPTAGGVLANTAVVDPNGVITETNENNNQSSDTVSVLGADLAVTKGNGQTSYLAGSVVTYTVTVTNLSGVDVTGAIVSDAIPANIASWTWVCAPAATGGATGCDGAALNSANFTDTVNLPVGGTIFYTVTANIVPNPTGDLVNTATVAVPTGYTDTNTNNNTSTDTDTLTLDSVDLAITKDDGQLGYSAGGTVTYTISVTNLSGSDVTGATVSDPIPANIASWTWVCAPAATGGATGCDGAASNSANFTDTVNLPVGGTIFYTVTAVVVASPTGALVNTATVTPPSGFADTDTSNNSSTDINTLLAADLSILKDDGQVTFAGSDTLIYTVTVTNLSGVTVTGAVVSDPIPANIASWTWVCTTVGGGASGCDGVSNSVDFTDTVNLPVGGTIIYTVTAVVVANPTGNLVNTATVSVPSGYTDTNPGNNTSTDTDFQGPVADLSLDKSVNNSAPTPLTNITFTLTLTNLGPDPATGVEVTDNLPSGFTYVSAVASQGTYDNVSGVWTVGNMAVNATETLTITVTVNLTGSYVNTAQVSASLEIDPVSTNNQDTVTVVPNFGTTPPSPTPTTIVSGFLIPDTGFAPNIVTELDAASRPAYASTTLAIQIPTLKVDTSIVGVEFKDGNWDVSWLQNQAGWLNGTAYPTWKGNSVLTAHAVNPDGKPGVFSGLKRLTAGEHIFVYNSGYRYTYRVESNSLVQADDFSVLRHEEKPYLTLVTCDTYDEQSGKYLLRVVVRAVLVDVRAVR